MKKAILDTNFILTCVKQKIDFFHELELNGISIIIPSQVIEELKKISGSKKKLHFREDAKLALKIMQKNKFDIIEFEEKYVDKGIINFAKKNKEIMVATLDKDIQSKTSNKKIIIRQKKKLELD